MSEDGGKAARVAERAALCRGLVGAGRDHSHDHRPDCKQICVALVETFDGFPLGHEVFEAAHWQANNSSRVCC